jgi:endoglucanase
MLQAAAPALQVNQVGYLQDGPKKATLICGCESVQEWKLVDDQGQVVATGSTEMFGLDPTVGQKVQVIDFSNFEEEGRYRLQVAEVVSDPVVIAANLYDGMLFDALNLFTLQRSGFEIGPEVAGPQYARAAGHLDIAPNQGDGQVRPLPKNTAINRDGVDLYEGWGGADYTVDGRGGWYDAGDAGKYVVNGGISVAQLLAIVEREKRAGNDTGSGSVAAFALDEAKWELDWIRRMQLPVEDASGQAVPLGGLVHHKLHDEHWTPIPTLPADDPMMRYVHRPSTAATLNFVAVAAQMARITAESEPEYSQALLQAADIGYAAAKSWPVLLAPDTNTIDNFGAGPYDDSEIEDEWYWAAAELYLTTGDPQYLDDLRSNAYHLDGSKAAFTEVGFDWRDVAPWARMQLALVESDLPERQEIISSITDWVEELLARRGPFGHLYVPATNEFAWGSNGMLANNAALAAAAFEAVGYGGFRSAALESLDYLLGRNALGLSYVTGYGVRDVKNQHSRWFAHAADSALPNPPAGTLSGGPNSVVFDPISEPMKGSPAQLCYIDDIASYATNEMTINWNAALALLVAFASNEG